MSGVVGQSRTDPANLRNASCATATGAAAPSSSLADRMKNDVCYSCKQRGHWSKECPKKRQGRVTGPSDSRGVATDGPSFPDKLCPCGAGVCTVKTSKTPANPGRKFYSCPLYPSSGRCKFFEWCGEASSSRGADPKVNDTVQSYPECSCRAGKGRLCTTNEGRKYFGCHIKKGEGACSFFQWYDPLENDSEDNLPDQSTKMVASDKFEGESIKIEGVLSNLSINKEHVPLSKVNSDMLSLEVAKDQEDNCQIDMAQDPEEVWDKVQPQANILGPTTKILQETETLEVDVADGLAEMAYLQLTKLTDVASTTSDVDVGERINKAERVEQTVQSEQGRSKNVRDEHYYKEIKLGGQDVTEEEMEKLCRVFELQMAKEYAMQKIAKEKQKEKKFEDTEDAENSADGDRESGGIKQWKGELMEMDEQIDASADAFLALSEDDFTMLESETNLSSIPITVLNRSPKTILEGMSEEDRPGINRPNCLDRGNAELRPGEHGEAVTSEEFDKLLSTVQAASVLAKHMQILTSTYASLRTMIEEDRRNMALVELEITRAKFEVECLKTALSAAEFKLKQAEEKKATHKGSLKIGVDALLPSVQRAKELANSFKIAAKAQQVFGACSFVACDSTKDLRASSSSMDRDETSERPDSECVTLINSVPVTNPHEEESTSVERCASNASRIEITILPGETTDRVQFGCEDVNNGLQRRGRRNSDVKDFGCGEGMLWMKQWVLSWICSRHGKVDYLKKD
ncbi:hypothetical protein H6P81_013428 [Aristolochia fimbriata]|uniref:CCHC-type domain-containing protein n=1 Tax=Aristolochia fimbriata TaxID=158543 RepID=A0AAV7EEN3_ARIFI|nr:hypothetical protein H6P81_013428 [Aristolochia fimbriata]